MLWRRFCSANPSFSLLWPLFLHSFVSPNSNFTFMVAEGQLNVSNTRIFQGVVICRNVWVFFYLFNFLSSSLKIGMHSDNQRGRKDKGSLDICGRKRYVHVSERICKYDLVGSEIKGRGLRKLSAFLSHWQVWHDQTMFGGKNYL